MNPLDREEYIEQAYFFRVLRERMLEGQATQSVLAAIHQEILSTTRLPYAIQFLATELKHSGLLSSGLARLNHYFTAFQTFIIRGSEEEARRFSADTAFLVLEREAEYRAGALTRPGLFVYQFEVICRNRLGYDQGMQAMAADPFYDENWKEYLGFVRQQLGLFDIADLIHVRSEAHAQKERRRDPDYQPSLPPLFGEKEGKIANANVDRDPLYLFAALQRQLGYPEVPRPRTSDDVSVKVETLHAKVRDLEMRLKLLEAEQRGKLDLQKLLKTEMLKDSPEEAW